MMKREVFRLKEKLYTHSFSVIPAETLFCLVQEGVYLSVSGHEHTVIPLEDHLLEPAGLQEVEEHPLLSQTKTFG